MTETVKQALPESIAEVLERMFFLCPVEAAPGAGNGDAPEIAVRLEFEGRPPGWLSLRLTRDAGRSLTADFLGLDAKDVSERQIGEVICEMANMICGSVLSKVESTAAFRLSPAVLMPALHGAAGTPLSDAMEHRMEICGSLLSVALSLERAV